MLLVIFCLDLDAQQISKEKVEALEAVESPQRRTSAELLSFDALAAYEQHGIQKVKDFFDYQNIIANKEYDLVFRKHALQLALDLFDSKKVKISIPKIQEKEIDIQTYLENFLKHTYSKVEFEVTDIKTVATSKIDRKNNYLNTIEYQVDVKITEGDRISAFSTTYSTDVILNRVVKQFGERKEEVWQVLLGTTHVK
ncbi:MAG: hypothetical protein AAGG68_03785 [Bacteroidota bacterium]